MDQPEEIKQNQTRTINFDMRICVTFSLYDWAFTCWRANKTYTKLLRNYLVVILVAPKLLYWKIPILLFLAKWILLSYLYYLQSVNPKFVLKNAHVHFQFTFDQIVCSKSLLSWESVLVGTKCQIRY